MAILKPGGKIVSATPVNGPYQLQNVPTPRAGAFQISYDGTPAYDPHQQKMEPIESEGPKKKRDQRPRNWYTEQCKIENHLQGMLLGHASLNSKGKSDGKNSS